MSCGCKKKAPVVTNQEKIQNVTIKLTESTIDSTTTQTQEELVDKIVAKLNDLDNGNQ
jgi:hypothetical protein